MDARQVMRLFEGEPLDEGEAGGVIAALAKSDAKTLATVCRRLHAEQGSLRRKLAKAQVEAERAQAVLAGIQTPPFAPGTVLRRCGDGMLDVASGGRRQIVGVAPELAEVELRAGDEVWLHAESGVAASRAAQGPRLGRIGVVAERLDDRVVVRGSDDAEQTVLCAPELAQELGAGDRILYSGEFPCVLERLPRPEQSAYQLQAPPDVSFEDVGGLDDVVSEIRADLELHVLHPELAARYRIDGMRGMVLAGPPGVGKSMLAAAIARFVADAAPETRFLDVKPGELRGPYYGQAESRIRELFERARSAPGRVILFFDELDHFGARGGGMEHEIDDRVLGALLVELSGLQAPDNVLVVGATNRLDLIDEALLRHGRFGDRVYEIPRPGRRGTREILGRLLVADLPWEDAESAQASAECAVAAATSHLHAPSGGAGAVLRVTHQDGSQEEVRAPALLSGALLASSVGRAKRSAARRELEGGAALALEDVVGALDEALEAEARKLSAAHVARRTLQTPRAHEIARVEVVFERRARPFARLRAV